MNRSEFVRNLQIAVDDASVRAVVQEQETKPGQGATDMWFRTFSPTMSVEAEGRLVEWLRRQPELSSFEDGFLGIGLGASQVSLTGLARWLVWRATKMGSSAA